MLAYVGRDGDARPDPRPGARRHHHRPGVVALGVRDQPAARRVGDLGHARAPWRSPSRPPTCRSTCSACCCCRSASARCNCALTRGVGRSWLASPELIVESGDRRDRLRRRRAAGAAHRLCGVPPRGVPRHQLRGRRFATTSSPARCCSSRSCSSRRCARARSAMARRWRA